MHFIQLYREDINIWEQNPFLSKIEPYKKLYKEDKKEGNILLSLYMTYDIKSPMYARIQNEAERIKDVSDTFLGDPNFDWEPYNEYVDAYKIDCRTEIQKQLDQLRDDIDRREAFARKLSFEDDEERALKLDLLDTQDKYIEKYKILVDKCADEVEDLESLGQYRKSYLEQLGIELEAELKK